MRCAKRIAAICVAGLLALTAFAPTLAQARDTQAPGSVRDYLLPAADPQTAARRHRVALPSSYRATQPAPLLIALHGYYGTPAIMQRMSGFDALAERAGLIVVYPEGRNGAWNAGRCCAPPNNAAPMEDDVAYIDALLEQLTTQFAIDATRVYLAGFSNGAMMAQRLSCERASRFAAIATIAGGLMTEPCPAAPAVATLLVQGRADPRIPWHGGYFNNSYRPSMREMVLGLRSRNHCGRGDTLLRRDDVIECRALRDCAAQASVEWCGLEAVGHQWPGSAIQLSAANGPWTDRYPASAEIVRFLLRHRRSPT